MNSVFENWKEIVSEEDIEEIVNVSKDRPVIIFKYSLRCGVSFSAMDALGDYWKEDEMEHATLYKVDVVRNRSLSQQVAQEFKVIHQSPQVLVIRDGIAIYNASHFRITFDSLKSQVA